MDEREKHRREHRDGDEHEGTERLRVLELSGIAAGSRIAQHPAHGGKPRNASHRTDEDGESYAPPLPPSRWAVRRWSWWWRREPADFVLPHTHAEWPIRLGCGRADRQIWRF